MLVARMTLRQPLGVGSNTYESGVDYDDNSVWKAQTTTPSSAPPALFYLELLLWRQGGVHRAHEHLCGLSRQLGEPLFQKLLGSLDLFLASQKHEDVAVLRVLADDMQAIAFAALDLLTLSRLVRCIST